MRTVLALILIVAGLVVLLAGGIFWRDRDTVVDAGPIQVQTEQQEGLRLPPVLGAVCIGAGVILLLVGRRRA